MLLPKIRPSSILPFLLGWMLLTLPPYHELCARLNCRVRTIYPISTQGAQHLRGRKESSERWINQAATAEDGSLHRSPSHATNGSSGTGKDESYNLSITHVADRPPTIKSQSSFPYHSSWPRSPRLPRSPCSIPTARENPDLGWSSFLALPEDGCPEIVEEGHVPGTADHRKVTTSPKQGKLWPHIPAQDEFPRRRPVRVARTIGHLYSSGQMQSSMDEDNQHSHDEISRRLQNEESQNSQGPLGMAIMGKTYASHGSDQPINPLSLPHFQYSDGQQWVAQHSDHAVDKFGIGYAEKLGAPSTTSPSATPRRSLSPSFARHHPIDEHDNVGGSDVLGDPSMTFPAAIQRGSSSSSSANHQTIDGYDVGDDEKSGAPSTTLPAAIRRCSSSPSSAPQRAMPASIRRCSSSLSSAPHHSMDEHDHVEDDEGLSAPCLFTSLLSTNISPHPPPRSKDITQLHQQYREGALVGSPYSKGTSVGLLDVDHVLESGAPNGYQSPRQAHRSSHRSPDSRARCSRPSSHRNAAEVAQNPIVIPNADSPSPGGCAVNTVTEAIARALGDTDIRLGVSGVGMVTPPETYRRYGSRDEGRSSSTPVIVMSPGTEGEDGRRRDITGGISISSQNTDVRQPTDICDGVPVRPPSAGRTRLQFRTTHSTELIHRFERYIDARVGGSASSMASIDDLMGSTQRHGDTDTSKSGTDNTIAPTVCRARPGEDSVSPAKRRVRRPGDVATRTETTPSLPTKVLHCYDCSHTSKQVVVVIPAAHFFTVKVSRLTAP